MNRWAPIADAGLTVPEVAADKTGRGILVAVIDTGVSFDHPHIALPPRGVTVEWVDDRLEVVDGAAPDSFGHGTCCAALTHWLAPDA